MFASQDVVSFSAGIAATGVTHESWHLGLQLCRQMNAKKAGHTKLRAYQKDISLGITPWIIFG